MKKSTYVPVLLAVGAIAVMYRIPKAREVLTGESDSWWPF